MSPCSRKAREYGLKLPFLKTEVEKSGYITIGVFVAMTNFANGDFSDSQISKLSANPHVKPNLAWFLWRLL